MKGLYERQWQGQGAAVQGGWRTSRGEGRWGPPASESPHTWPSQLHICTHSFLWVHALCRHCRKITGHPSLQQHVSAVLTLFGITHIECAGQLQPDVCALCMWNKLVKFATYTTVCSLYFSKARCVSCVQECKLGKAGLQLERHERVW